MPHNHAEYEQYRKERYHEHQFYGSEHQRDQHAVPADNRQMHLVDQQRSHVGSTQESIKRHHTPARTIATGPAGHADMVYVPFCRQVTRLTHRDV